MTDSFFPYGAFPLDEMFRERYYADYSHASHYPLSDTFPYHHPLLKRLEGNYALSDRPAPWWPACLAEIDPVLREVLSTVSAREFREGCIEALRWKQFRQSLSEEQRRMVPQSPKLAPMLEQTDWLYAFQQRGASDTPAQLNLVISTSPLYALYMSNGQDWTSCQHFRTGEYNEQLVGNFYDTNVAIVILLAPQTNVWEPQAVLARTTIRIFEEQEQTRIAIGQIYHNNDTLACLLLCQLARLFDAHQLSWGFLSFVNTLSYCQKGFLGGELQQRILEGTEARMWSCPFWLPPDWSSPYVDGGDFSWEWTDASSWRLRATLQLMKPLSTLAYAA